MVRGSVVRGASFVDPCLLSSFRSQFSFGLPPATCHLHCTCWQWSSMKGDGYGEDNGDGAILFRTGVPDMGRAHSPTPLILMQRHINNKKQK